MREMFLFIIVVLVVLALALFAVSLIPLAGAPFFIKPLISFLCVVGAAYAIAGKAGWF